MNSLTSLTSMTALATTASIDDSLLHDPLRLLLVSGLVILIVAVAGLFVAVVLSILRSSLSPGLKLLWVIFVFWVPVLAWFAWYLLGRPHAQRADPQRADLQPSEGTPVMG